MTFFTTAVRIARTIAIALWVGAMAGFAFLFAPVAFRIIGPNAAFASTIATTIRAVTVFGWACAAIAAAATVMLARRTSRTTIPLLAALALMSALSSFEVWTVIPKMERTKLQTPAYDALHRESSRVYGAALVLGLVSLALISIRDVGER